jgi:hypothetical protein
MLASGLRLAQRGVFVQQGSVLSFSVDTPQAPLLVCLAGVAPALILLVTFANEYYVVLEAILSHSLSSEIGPHCGGAIGGVARHAGLHARIRRMMERRRLENSNRRLAIDEITENFIRIGHVDFTEEESVKLFGHRPTSDVAAIRKDNFIDVARAIARIRTCEMHPLNEESRREIVYLEHLFRME